MKKVLIISYYWPPAGGGGVQRWLKMSKYFPENGWKPIIYTAEPDTYVAEDKSLLADVHIDCEVIKTPIWEPYKIYALLTGKSKKESKYSGFISDKEKPSWKDKLSMYIRSNFFIPDARKFWIKPSIKYVNNWLKTNEIDAIISTGPPHSMHLIALGVKKANKHIPWIADFRDPWTFQDFYDQLPLSKSSDKKHKGLEKQVFSHADHIVTVSWDWQSKMKSLFNTDKVSLILNGYDHQDFDNDTLKEKTSFIIMQLGSMNKDRNTTVIWKAVKNIISKNKGTNISIELIGPIDHAVKASIEEVGLASNVSYRDFLPHKEAMSKLYEASILILPINKTSNNKGILPGKLYEYIATQLPILAIGPEQSDISKVLSTISNSQLFDYDDTQGVETFILKEYNSFKLKENKTNSSNYQQYSRQNHAKKYTSLLHDIITKEI